jgi:hypothetical protein
MHIADSAAVLLGTNEANDALLSNPITGMPGCCARAASDHLSVASPSNVMIAHHFV